MLHKYINKLFSLTVLLFIAGATLNAQEELRNPYGNLELQRIASRPQTNKSRLKAVKADTLKLPFVDDFSSTTIYPNPKLWADSDVYVNSYMSKNILSIGVATFDNINSKGFVYSNASVTPFRADYLTSRPINLGGLTASDSVYLSFLYEPHGNVDNPEPEDSLYLEFYSPDTKTWDSIWSTPGYSSSVFKHQLKPIKDSKYLMNGFRFRFRNIASMQTSETVPGKVGIQDTWHLDYVKLDKGRNINDTVIRDVAFIKPLTSFLKTYQSMPWNHFQKAYVNELRGHTDVTFRNNDTIDRYVYEKDFIFKELGNNSSYSFSVGGDSISKGSESNLQAEFKNPFSSSTDDTTVYNITSYLWTDDNINYKWNDTIRFQQVFSKYFAYDDGTAESGFGLSGEGTSNALYACQFNAYVTDTLRAIDIYFNPTYNNVNEYYTFKLAVWADNKGFPGKMVYLSSVEQKPNPGKINQFNTYWLDTAVVVSDKFYIGWKQLNENFLNFGYDLNTDSRSYLFKNITGTWVKPGNIIAAGSIMMRPNFRRNNKTVDVPDIHSVEKLKVYPNPFKNSINIANTENLKIREINIFNTIGQLVVTFSGHENETLNVSGLKSGMYIVKIVTEKGSVRTFKMMKEK